MTLTDREKALVEAARAWTNSRDTEAEVHAANKIFDALRAYDPPKPKVPVLPEWNEITKHGCVGVDANCGQYIVWNGVPLYQSAYNHLRELTAKDSE